MDADDSCFLTKPNPREQTESWGPGVPRFAFWGFQITRLHSKVALPSEGGSSDSGDRG